MNKEQKTHRAMEFVSMIKKCKDDSELLDLSLTMINKFEEVVMNKYASQFIVDKQGLKDKLERYAESYFRKSNTYTLYKYVLKQIIEGFLNEIKINTLPEQKGDFRCGQGDNRCKIDNFQEKNNQNIYTRLSDECLSHIDGICKLPPNSCKQCLNKNK